MTLGVKIKTMNTPMKPMQIICGNIHLLFSEFSELSAHVSYFSEKINQSYISAIFQYEQCYNTLIKENSQRMNRSCIVAYTT